VQAAKLAAPTAGGKAGHSGHPGLWQYKLSADLSFPCCLNCVQYAVVIVSYRRLKMESCNAYLSSLLRTPPSDLSQVLHLFSIRTEGSLESNRDELQNLTKERPPLFLRCISRLDTSAFVSSGGSEQGDEVNSTIRSYIERGGRGFFMGPLGKGEKAAAASAAAAATTNLADTRAATTPESPLLLTPQIVIVAEHLEGPSDLEKLLRHELVHAVDAGIHQLDLAVSGPLACSEVRAAAAAECASYRVDPLVWWHPLSDFLKQRCVKNHAVSSLQAVFPDIATQAVDAAFAPCYSTPPHRNPLAEHPSFAAAIKCNDAAQLHKVA
jgi:hypothetical protein